MIINLVTLQWFFVCLIVWHKIGSWDFQTIRLWEPLKRSQLFKKHVLYRLLKKYIENQLNLGSAYWPSFPLLSCNSFGLKKGALTPRNIYFLFWEIVVILRNISSLKIRWWYGEGVYRWDYVVPIYQDLTTPIRLGQLSFEWMTW